MHIFCWVKSMQLNGIINVINETVKFQRQISDHAKETQKSLTLQRKSACPELPTFILFIVIGVIE